MSDFSLHPQLAQDCIYIGKMNLCHVLLMNNAYFRWFVLVPEVSEEQVVDLSIPDRALLQAEVQHVSEAMQRVLNPDKMNIGSIGNIVPQLHYHIIARFENDAAWPNVVWGFKDTIAYENSLIDDMIKELDINLKSKAEL